jgi:hypothetical protein
MTCLDLLLRDFRLLIDVETLKKDSKNREKMILSFVDNSDDSRESRRVAELSRGEIYNDVSHHPSIDEEKIKYKNID